MELFIKGGNSACIVWPQKNILFYHIIFVTCLRRPRGKTGEWTAYLRQNMQKMWIDQFQSAVQNCFRKREANRLNSKSAISKSRQHQLEILLVWLEKAFWVKYQYETVWNNGRLRPNNCWRHLGPKTFMNLSADAGHLRQYKCRRNPYCWDNDSVFCVDFYRFNKNKNSDPRGAIHLMTMGMRLTSYDMCNFKQFGATYPLDADFASFINFKFLFVWLLKNVFTVWLFSRLLRRIRSEYWVVFHNFSGYLTCISMLNKSFK